ncbi:MAG: IS66 family insertion sequence element accessory protein TnpB [bacterium]|nr:IS66 family insertion sequence element accessory protein TnpB [bacterium]
MIQVTPQMRVYVAVEPADFRCGIDGLSRLVRERLERDPFSGCVVVFRNRRRTAVKLLAYDGQGYWLCHKRFSAGRFSYWPDGGQDVQLEAQQLHVLLSGGNFKAAQGAPVWRPIETAA